MNFPESDRLSYRKIDIKDKKILSTILKDNSVMKYCGGAIDDKGVDSWIVATIDCYEKYGYDYFVVEKKETKEFIGQAGVLKEIIDNEEKICIAFMIKKDKWKKGYGIEMAKACVEYALYKLCLTKIYATVENENVASKKILQKLGMKKEKEVTYLGSKVNLYCLNKEK